MTRRALLERLAALAAEQAAVLGQLAALEDEDGTAIPAPPASRPRARAVRVVASPRADAPGDEVARMRGRKAAGDILRRKGIPV